MYLNIRNRSYGDAVKADWKRKNEGITTDQKNLTDDPHLHEEDKQHLKKSEKQEGFIPKKGGTTRPKKEP